MNVDQQSPWKKPMTRRQKIFWGLVLLVIVVAAFSQPSSDDSAQSTARTVSAPKQPAPLKLDKQGVSQLVTAEMGDVNREGVRRVKTVEIDASDEPSEKGLFIVTVTFAADDNLSGTYIRHGIAKNIVGAAKRLCDQFPRITYVGMHATFAMKDKYGSVKEDRIAFVGYSRSTLEKMHPENLNGDEMLDLADFKFINPSLLR